MAERKDLKLQDVIARITCDTVGITVNHDGLRYMQRFSDHYRCLDPGSELPFPRFMGVRIYLITSQHQRYIVFNGQYNLEQYLIACGVDGEKNANL